MDGASHPTALDSVRDVDNAGLTTTKASQVQLQGEFGSLPAGLHHPPALSVRVSPAYYSSSQLFLLFGIQYR